MITQMLQNLPSKCKTSIMNGGKFDTKSFVLQLTILTTANIVYWVMPYQNLFAYYQLHEKG